MAASFFRDSAICAFVLKIVLLLLYTHNITRIFELMNDQNSPKNITIQDIAKELGTSSSTVSRALNDHPKISKQTKQKVLNMAVKLGYMPNLPSLMLEEENKVIAIVIPTINDSFYREIVSSVKQSIEKENFTLFVCETDYNIEKEEIYLRQIELLKFKGFIYISHQDSNLLGSLERLISKKTPSVVIHDNKLKSGAATIVLDVYQSLTEIISHLKSNGAKKIALIIDDLKNSVLAQVDIQFEKVLLNEGLEYCPELVHYVYDEKNEFLPLLNDILLNDHVPDGIIVSSHEKAFKIQQFIQNHKTNDLKDILIVSLAKDQIAAFARPKITHLDLQGSEIGKEAARLVVQQMRVMTEVVTKVFFSNLIIKSSSIRI